MRLSFDEPRAPQKAIYLEESRSNLKDLKYLYREVKSNRPLSFCLAMYFSIKAIADTLLQSSSILIHKCFTRNNHPISEENSEIYAIRYIIVLGFFIVPINIVVNHMKEKGKENREQLIGWHLMVFIGCFMMLFLVGWGDETVTSFHFISYLFAIKNKLDDGDESETDSDYLPDDVRST